MIKINKNRSKLRITPRGTAILKFIWKFKVVTTSAIHKRFFNESSPEAAYRRLMKLRDIGVIEECFEPTGHGWVWILTQKGFGFIKESLPSLREEGHKSESLRHDLICNAAQFGPWLESTPQIVTLVSEQQLRRIKGDNLPAWIPDTDFHRPDGYWHFDLGEEKFTLALEVEISQKVTQKYRDILSGYKYLDSIDRVLWIVNGQGLKRKIESTIAEFTNPESSKHNFIDLTTFLKSSWNSPILNGPEKGSTMANVLGTDLSLTHPQGDIHPFLDPRKKCVVSNSYPKAKTS